ELALGPDRHQRAERDKAPLAALEARPGPHVAPRRSRDELLEARRELRRARQRAVDVRVAEHLAAHAEAVRIELHHSPPRRWPSSAALYATGCAMLPRCAASSSTRNSAPWMPSAISAPCAGGVDGSSAPAITSVGATISSRSSRRSMTWIAWLQLA